MAAANGRAELSPADRKKLLVIACTCDRLELALIWRRRPAMSPADALRQLRSLAGIAGLALRPLLPRWLRLGALGLRLWRAWR